MAHMRTELLEAVYATAKAYLWAHLRAAHDPENWARAQKIRYDELIAAVDAVTDWDSEAGSLKEA